MSEPRGYPARPDESTDSALRDRAIRRLRKRRDFMGHLLVYVLVNTFVVVIWLMTSDGGFFWPIFPMAGWGIGLVMNAWGVWRAEEFDEEQILREMRHLTSRNATDVSAPRAKA